MFKSKLIYIATIFSICLPFFGFAESASSECKQRFRSEVVPTYNSYGAISAIEKLKKIKSICGDSGFYFLKLGWFHLENRDLDQASSSFDRGLQINDSYAEDLKLASIHMFFQYAVSNPDSIDEGLLERADREMNAFIMKYPNNGHAYALITGVNLTKGEYELVLENGAKAITRGDFHSAYRNMAIAYSRLELTEDTIVAASAALELMDSLKGDRDLMLATAVAFMKLNKFENSIGVIEMLVAANPDLKDDELVNKIATLVQIKYNLLQ